MTTYQAQTLMKRFKNKPFLEREEKDQLAELLNISGKRIQDWYMNRRQERRKSELFGKGEEC